MFALPNLIVHFTAALLFFNLNCKANAEMHIQRNVSFTKMMRTNEFENNHNMLANCVADFLETASYTFSSDVIMNYYSGNGSIKFVLGDLVERILEHNVMITKFFSNTAAADGYFSLWVELIDSYDSLINFPKDSYVIAAIKTCKKYIIIILMVPDYFNKAPIKEMQKIFQEFYSYRSTDVNIMVATSKQVSVYTFYPYEYGQCGSTRPVLLCSCSEKTGYSFCRRNLFPLKNPNMNLCPLKVAAAHLPPFIILKNPFIGEESLTGIDGEILKVISSKLNFSIALSESINEIGGTVYDNGTSTGVFKVLRGQQADLTLGYSECTPNRLRFLASTRSYYQTSLRILLKDSEGYSPMETVFFPFSTSTWIIVLTANILRIILSVLKHYQYHKRLHRAVPNILYITWCYLTLIFCSSYGSLFFTFMLNQPAKPLPKSFDELREQNYTILTDVIQASIADNIPELKDLLIIVNTTPYQVLSEFEKSSSNRHGALTNMETFSYFAKNESKSLDNYVNFNERLMDSMFCMYFPFLSNFKYEFNERIEQLNTFGLSAQIAREFTNPINLPNTKDYRTHHGSDASSIEILTLYHLKGPFIIFFGCQAIALIAFIFELLSLKFRLLRRAFIVFAK